MQDEARPSFLNMRQLGNCLKNRLLGWSAHTTHLPIAIA